MDDKKREMIREVKSHIFAMLDERDRLTLEGRDIILASAYWSDFCSFFDYMLWLPEEAFAKIRLHTYHLTGDNYQTYYFETGAESLRAAWEELVEGMPGMYVLYEPEGGIGFRFTDGRVVSRDILRYQRVVRTLYHRGVISSLAEVGAGRRLVLEIGGGYGGLAHHLSRICGNTTYVIVDLPETLLFSGAYLCLLNPEKKIYIYARDHFMEMMRPGILESYDFVLLPNFRVHSIDHLRFDLAISVASLQEMRTAQAEAYLDFVRGTCRGVFYSWNQDRQPRNKELISLSELLRGRFEVSEVRDWRPSKSALLRDWRKRARLKVREMLRWAGVVARILDRPKCVDLPYREYICKPLGGGDGR